MATLAAPEGITPSLWKQVFWTLWELRFLISRARSENTAFFLRMRTTHTPPEMTCETIGLFKFRSSKGYFPKAQGKKLTPTQTNKSGLI